jgi:hypothetical protein
MKCEYCGKLLESADDHPDTTHCAEYLRNVLVAVEKEIFAAISDIEEKLIFENEYEYVESRLGDVLEILRGE